MLTNVEEVVKYLRESTKEATPEEIDRIRATLYNAKRAAKGLRFHGYIPNEFLPYKKLVLDYLVDNGLIKKPSMYALASFATRSLFISVLKQIKKAQETPNITT
jgi:hypothetical protein